MLNGQNNWEISLWQFLAKVLAIILDNCSLRLARCFRWNESSDDARRLCTDAFIRESVDRTVDPRTELVCAVDKLSGKQKKRGGKLCQPYLAITQMARVARLVKCENEDKRLSDTGRRASAAQRRR